jgi:acyl phosphate:glycerol-3-phosphate acyltransferase
MLIAFILLSLCGYFLGSIPFGYLISRAHGIDIRKVGSGSTGATNVSRKLGIWWALLVGFLDVLKAVVITYFAVLFLNTAWQIVFVALTPVIGHIFCIWLGFKGGKGVGTMVGILFVLFGWKFIAVWLLIWVILLYFTKLMSLVNLLMVLSLPFLFWIQFKDIVSVCLSVVLCAIIWYAHRENIIRLFNGKELKLSI